MVMVNEVGDGQGARRKEEGGGEAFTTSPLPLALARRHVAGCNDSIYHEECRLGSRRLFQYSRGRVVVGGVRS